MYHSETARRYHNLAILQRVSAWRRPAERAPFLPGWL